MYKKPSIGGVRLDGWALLAPMAGVSDLAYRVIAHRMGAALTTAEMVSAKGLYYKNEKTEDMLKIDPGEHPVALQLFGSDPEIMALGAKEMEKAGPDIIDINMGCPMQKVHILLRHGRRAVEHDGEAGQALGDLFQNVETQGRISSISIWAVPCRRWSRMAMVLH